MYTATKLGHSDNKELHRRIVTVKFEDISIPHEFVKDFQFRLTDTVDVIKRTVSNYLDELNAPTITLADNETDFTVTPVEPVKTAAELAKEAWDADWAKLSAIQPYIIAGVFTGTETPIVNLRNKVKTGFKAEYLGL